uniref:Alpha-carbonic anhydrase domain-containing protein n=1 Tax=Nomascus leucogenys TaxID=61853 RepID=A0A2I3GQA4_NOMLE
MLFFILLLEAIWILAADEGQHWTYECPHTFYPECGNNTQSPFDIQTDSMTALQPHGYDQPGTEPLDLHKNNYTVQLSLPSTLYLGGLSRKYVATQLHLHWGQDDPQGINSEATIAELHIIHYDSDSCDSLSEAAQRPQGLTVLGILIEVSETKNINIAYEHILDHLHEIKHKDQKTSVRELLPRQLGQFFLYTSSLTTSPCYARAQISMEQLEKLQETVLSTEEGPSKLLSPSASQPTMTFAFFIQMGSLYPTGEMLSLGVGILKKRLENQKNVVITSA